mmetsp:Transcript_3026/g.6705  ORF Transcript_3026/g.6705 Transcript_3026/m.6705 type:complete len:86 (-) Transcript_3026:1701-1958(-)
MDQPKFNKRQFIAQGVHEQEWLLHTEKTVPAVTPTISWWTVRSSEKFSRNATTDQSPTQNAACLLAKAKTKKHGGKMLRVQKGFP